MNTLDPAIAGAFDSVQVGDPFSISYVIDAAAPSIVGGYSWVLFTDQIQSVSLNIGGVSSTELLGSTIRLENNFGTPTFQCQDLMRFESGGASFSTLFVQVRAFVNGTPCPSVFDSLGLPAALDPDDFNIAGFTLVGLGTALLAGDTTRIVVSSGDFPESCNGDGGNQTGCTNCPCSNNAPVGSRGGCLNSSGEGLRLLGSGSPVISLPLGSTNDLRFAATGAPPAAFCVLVSGAAVAPGNMANPCFGMSSGVQSTAFDGLRCAIADTRRHGGRSADLNGAVGATNSPWGGEGNPGVGLANAGPGFAPGQTRFFQAIHRDAPLLGCMRGLNTSQAIEIVFVP